jgi:MoaA/NifB/PqqE/SkfB family radical SAM enzyme
LAAKRGLELGVVAAHGAETHLGVETAPTGDMPAWLAEPFERLIALWLRSWRPRQWLRAHFAFGTYRLLAGSRWRFRCRAADDFFFLQADGTVHSCSVHGRPMGNIVHQDWEEIWRGPAAGPARQFVAGCPESCWMVCTARSFYRRHVPGVLAWIVWHKVLAHLGRLRLPAPPEAREGQAESKSGADRPH